MYDYSEEKKKEHTQWLSKETGGAVLFFVIVLVHVLNSFFGDAIHISNPKISILVTQALIVAPVFIYIACMRENPFRFIRFRKFHLGSAFLIPVFMICIWPVISFINAFSMLFSTNTISSSIDTITGGSMIWGLLLVALLPAFVEETTFRGGLYHSLRGVKPIRAIILSGLMFGAMHMNFNQFMYAAFLGIVMGFLLEATGSIVSTMILHFCFNGSSVVLMCLLPKIMQVLYKMSPQQYSEQLANASNYSPKEALLMMIVLIPLAAGGGFLAFLVYMCIAKLNKRWNYIKFLFSKSAKTQLEAFNPPKLINPVSAVFLILGFGTCLVVCVLTELIHKGIINL